MPSTQFLMATATQQPDTSAACHVMMSRRRHFWWYAGQLWLEDVRCPVFLGLSGADEIVPSAAVRDYVHLHHAR
jgi:hypothetical protein